MVFPTASRVLLLLLQIVDKSIPWMPRVEVIDAKRWALQEHCHCSSFHHSMQHMRHTL
jgi:hypothetical protein